MSLDLIDRQILNVIQSEFPLEREPFSVIGSKLGVSDKEVLRRVRHLKDSNVIRSISAVFNATGLGYHSTLVAMHIDGASVDEAAAVINCHPGVSHNYLRDHYLNLWFTLTTTKEIDPGEAAHELGQSVRSELTLSLPTRRAFKINVCFDMLGPDGVQYGKKRIHSRREDGDKLSETDISLVRELQQDLPVVAQPFNMMAASLGLEFDEFLDGVASLFERGIMRRYGARLDHWKAGFVANAMSCWTVAPDRINEAGKLMASYGKVSHCYERQTAPEWPYNLYAMIHGQNEEESCSFARQLAKELAITEYVLLYSTKEYLKRRVKYFMS